MHHCSFSSQTWPGSRSSLSERPLPYQPTMTLPTYTGRDVTTYYTTRPVTASLVHAQAGMHTLAAHRHASPPPTHTVTASLVKYMRRHAYLAAHQHASHIRTHRRRLTGTCKGMHVKRTSAPPPHTHAVATSLIHAQACIPSGTSGMPPPPTHTPSPPRTLVHAQALSTGMYTKRHIGMPLSHTHTVAASLVCAQACMSSGTPAHPPPHTHTATASLVPSSPAQG